VGNPLKIRFLGLLVYNSVFGPFSSVITTIFYKTKRWMNGCFDELYGMILIDGLIDVMMID